MNFFLDFGCAVVKWLSLVHKTEIFGGIKTLLVACLSFSMVKASKRTSNVTKMVKRIHKEFPLDSKSSTYLAYHLSNHANFWCIFYIFTHEFSVEKKKFFKFLY